MMLPALIAVLCLGGFAAWFSERRSPDAPRWVAIITLAIEAPLLAVQYKKTELIDLFSTSMSPAWLADLYLPWIPRFGIGFHLAMDGLSLLLIALTVLLGFMAVSSSWTEINNRQGFFFFNLLTCLGRYRRRIFGGRSVPVLFFLGTDDHPDVFPDQYLGA